ncbi:hypothetical protein AL542_02335 [Grimontia hollisae]|uniref:Uncharacterized protein n=2 Tax=Grimontia hollisae TaxID=673 RepID=D0I5B6_GRIHO|nr:hypothetical protein [Grimontia hollisae]AMG29296.1 hypothetical protein AL542_02335 [Grimontia hollisae]EEY73080.1 hypothetical protein VHA_000933 [Grimontia hollisae CIP 101886]MDF2183919.1 hypothetical protein [Grimontia hollisae]STO77764.1 Uncharacterised protein [Grimontia hollisae]STO98654.1 Uncharacterised protein [Grimontia hollisae]
MSTFWGKVNASLSETLKDLSEYQERVWIVSIRDNLLLNDSFVVSEDTFREPMDWMIDQGYPDDVLEALEYQKLSQTISVKVGNVEHCIMRVK